MKMSRLLLIVFLLYFLLLCYMQEKDYINPAVIGLLKVNEIPSETMYKRTHKWLLAKINRRPESFVDRRGVIHPLVNYREIFLISKKYRLATCQIEKVMSTFRNGLFCYLNRQHQFQKEKRNISTEHWTNTLCKDNKDERKTYYDTVASLGKDPVIFSFIRHPLERFLSGYVDKCIKEKVFENRCFQCSQNLTCFLKNLKMTLSIFSNSIRNLTYMENYNVRHFAPSTWYCNLEKSISQMIFIKYHKDRKQLADDLNKVLERARIGLDQRIYIIKELHRQLPVHSTAHSLERVKIKEALLSNPQLHRLFMDIYYYDFVVFEFEFPQQIQVS